VATRVLSIERFQSDRTVAEAGECIGITLPADIAPRRGQVLCEQEAVPSVVSAARARVFWMVDEPLRKGERVTLRVCTQETACQVTAVAVRIDSSSLDVLGEDAEALNQTEVGELHLALAPPIVAELASSHPSLGRLVLERDGTLAGAGILIGLDGP